MQQLDEEIMLRNIGRIKLIPGGLIAMRVQCAIFEDEAPRYELNMPRFNLARMFFGSLICPQTTIKIVDKVLNKTSGLIIQKPFCN